MDKTSVLVVEDEALVAMDIKYTLERLGYTVTGIVGTGEEAVRAADQQKPDVVLMDIVLRGMMDGIQAATEIRGRFDIPVVYLTAYADEAKIQRAKLSEPFAYIMKPFQDRELHGNIQVALYKHGMEHALRESHAKMERTMRATLDVMAKLVELKDPSLAGHQLRVARLSKALALELGLPEAEAEGIGLAASVHATGLLGIPFNILSKPTPLTIQEEQLFQTHTLLGYNLFKDIDFPWPVAEVALHHHEHVDGSGYPDGLQGDRISLASRIVAVASAVDFIASGGAHAFVSPEVKGVDVALAEIAKGKGSLYDANVVGACLRLFKEKAFRLEG
jgi:response regulator RpfG family c-di-GMP phosphodiesterase